MQRRDETVASFRNGIALLRSFGRDARRQTITEAAGRTGLSRAAARRLLRTLCATGLARTDGKHFELTPAVLELGQSFLSGMTEIDIIRGVLGDFARRTGGSISAAMLVGTEVIYIARQPAPGRDLPTALGAGMRRPAHATAIGHVLLASLGERELDRYLAGAVLAAHTPRTITNRRDLRARLAMVRAQGYAVLDEELILGLRSIAVAVPTNATGTRIGIASGSQEHSVAEMTAAVLPALRQAADMIGLAVDQA